MEDTVEIEVEQLPGIRHLYGSYMHLDFVQFPSIITARTRLLSALVRVWPSVDSCYLGHLLSLHAALPYQLRYITLHCYQVGS